MKRTAFYILTLIILGNLWMPQISANTVAFIYGGSADHGILSEKRDFSEGCLGVNDAPGIYEDYGCEGVGEPEDLENDAGALCGLYALHVLVKVRKVHAIVKIYFASRNLALAYSPRAPPYFV